MNPHLEKFVPADLRDIIARMEEWAQEQRLLDRATEACRSDLRYCAAERWDGWERLQGHDLEAVTVKFFRHSLMFQHNGLAAPNVVTEFMLFHTPHFEENALGSYRFSVRLDGKAFGSHLIIFPVAEDASA